MDDLDLVCAAAAVWRARAVRASASVARVHHAYILPICHRPPGIPASMYTLVLVRTSSNDVALLPPRPRPTPHTPNVKTG